MHLKCRRSKLVSFVSPDIKLGTWLELKPLALPLRLAVFVQEQGVPTELEQDEYDDTALHAVIVGQDGKAVATGRLVISEQGVAKIGRLAVAKVCRGHGLGKAVLQALVKKARSREIKAVKLHAQCDAEDFYSRLGFVTRGEPFMEAGIQHVLMVKDLSLQVS